LGKQTLSRLPAILGVGAQAAFERQVIQIWTREDVQRPDAAIALIGYVESLNP
jgi:hypothetical protein